MRFRFTLTNMPKLPPFDQWTDQDQPGQAGTWTIDSTPSVSIAGPGGSSFGSDCVFAPGTYHFDYNISITSTGTSASMSIIFEKDGGAVGVGDTNNIPGAGSAGNFTGTITVVITEPSENVLISFLNFGVNTRVFTINSLTITTDPLEISEPDGWKGGKLKLERDDQFFSLIERYEGAAGGAFIFYGENGEENGGIEFIRDVEENFGFDANIEFLAEFAPDDVDYQEIFNGLLELSGKNEMKDNKMQVPVIRDDMWSKFMNRMDTPVNLSDLADLDGNSVDPVIPITVNLTSQKIRYNGEYLWNETVQYPEPAGDGTIQIDWDEVVVDDIKKFNLPRVDVTTTPLNLIAGLFEAPYDGVYTFDIRIESGSFFGGSWQDAFAEPRFRIGNAGAGVNETDYRAFTSSSINNGGQYLWVHTFNGSFLLAKGQQIVIFGRTNSGAGTTNVFGNRINNWLTDVDVATTTSITLSGTQTIDGYAAGVGDRVLAKNQSDPKENGVWVVAAGAWTRATDANTSVELQDATMLILNGDTNGNTYWIQATENVVLGTTAITFRTTTYNDTKLVDYPGTGTPDNHLIITADTTYKETTAEGYLIYDLIQGVLARIGLGPNSFYSEFLGADGCGWMYAILKGLQIRQYTLTEKPFFISFKQIWDGVNPILNLGLGYETVEDPENSSLEIQVIRIEEKAHFVEDDISVYFSNVREISSSYDQSMIFKTIKTGYKKWQSEDISGIDDPQTKHTYSTRFEKVGKEINLESEFIAAGLAIETTRRTTREKSADYKYDNDNFIIALNQDDVSPDVYLPELDENFDSVTGILNSDTRYNLILTPMRSLLRWANFLGGCLQSYTTSSYKFVSGEGNYDMVSNYFCGGGNECQAILCDALGESQDIPLGPPTNYNTPFGYFFLPMIYDITIPMEWEEYQEIRNSRKKAIGISQSDTGHIAFKIKQLEYDIVKGEAIIKAWPKTFFRINIIDNNPEMQCQTSE